MRSLERFNTFMIRRGTDFKATRTWHNHHLRLKCLDNLGRFQFIRRWIIKDRWLRKINSARIKIMIRWINKKITTIRKFRVMNRGILMIWWNIKRGWWKMRNFTLYIPRKIRWSIGRIMENIFVLSAFRWKTSIPRVLRMIQSSNIRKLIFTRFNQNDRIMENVNIMWKRCG